MLPQWEPAQQKGAMAAWRNVLRPLASDLDRDARSLAHETVQRMQEMAPDTFRDPTSVEQLRANVELGIRAIAATIGAGSDPTEIELPALLVAGARSRAQQSFPLATLLRTIRIAHELIFEWAMALIHERADKALQPAAAELAALWMFRAIDQIATLYAGAYEAERERWLRSAAAIRSETVAAVLDGTELDADRASTRMGYALGSHHLGILVWMSEGPDHVGPATLQSAIDWIASRTGADGTLIEPLGLLAAMGWVSRRQAFDAAAVEKLGARLADAHGPCVAVGEPRPGIAGFRQTHEEAAHARRVASLLGRRPGSVTSYRQVELIAIATLDIDRTRSFVDRTLRSLAASDDTTRRLAATVEVYLQEGCSRTRAAKRLGIHENTVGYRIRQAEGLLGRTVLSDQLALGVALTLLPAVRVRGA